MASANQSVVLFVVCAVLSLLIHSCTATRTDNDVFPVNLNELTLEDILLTLQHDKPNSFQIEEKKRGFNFHGARGKKSLKANEKRSSLSISYGPKDCLTRVGSKYRTVVMNTAPTMEQNIYRSVKCTNSNRFSIGFCPELPNS